MRRVLQVALVLVAFWFLWHYGTALQNTVLQRGYQMEGGR